MMTRMAAFVVTFMGLPFFSPALAQRVETPSETIKDAFAARCAALNGLNLERSAEMPAQIVSAELVVDRAASRWESTMFVKRGHVYGLPTQPFQSYPAHCRVEGYVAPHIQFMMMLPPSNEGWNGRFLLNACDGLCGAVHDNAVVPGLARGFASMTSNGGHYSRAPFDAIWGYNDRVAEINFGYRANHLVAQVGKAIVAAYYGKQPSYSYMAGMSRGGTASVISAQRYPKDFNGVLAKAPVIHYSDKNNINAPYIARAIYPDGETAVMDSSKIHLVANAVMKACDRIDGLEDGIIEDPRMCKFDPGVLLCAKGQDESSCLTKIQVNAVRQIYAVPTGANGKVVYPVGNNYGSEGDWPRFMFPEPGSHTPAFFYQIARGSLRYLAFEEDPGPGYNWRAFDPITERDKLKFMAGIVDGDSPDLSKFNDAGGKMIVIHGLADGAVAAQMTMRWFDTVVDYAGGQEAVGKFAQLYIVPGVKHGSGGQGPYEHAALEALMDWVEKGTAPKKLDFVDDLVVREGTPDFVKVKRSRPAFPYPDRAVYSGGGDPNVASSYVREAGYFLGEPHAPPFTRRH